MDLLLYNFTYVQVLPRFTILIFDSMADMCVLPLPHRVVVPFFFLFFLSIRIFLLALDFLFLFVGSCLRSILNIFYFSFYLRLILLTIECAIALVEDSIATTISELCFVLSFLL